MKGEGSRVVGGKKIMKKCSISTGKIMKKSFSMGKITKKCSTSMQDPRSESHHNNYPKVLTFEVQSRILECLQIEDLFGSCLLVCKQWKDEILLSEPFARLQRRRSLWVYLKSRTPYYSATPYYPNKALVFQNGPYKVLNLMLERGETIRCFDKGIVCVKGFNSAGQMRVGNPIKGNWKVIPTPSKLFLPDAISVDTSTSPASFKIIASTTDPYILETEVSSLQTEIFDSKTNTWSNGNSVPLNGPFQEKLGRTLVMVPRATKKIVTYDFEQDIWSVKSYLSPEKAGREEILRCKEEPILVSHLPWRDDILLCREEPILVSHLWPWVMLWKESSCYKGIIQWGLMTKLDIKAFLPQHNLETKCEVYAHYTTGNVIVLVMKLPSEKTALLNYDMKKGGWEIGGFMEGACGHDLGINFAPSLIIV